MGEDTDESAGDPFAGWPAAESAAVIEDAPQDGASVEHVRGEVEVPDGYTVLEGHAARQSPLGRSRRLALQRRRHEPDAAERARCARARRASPRTRSRSCRSRERSSCRSQRWRSRRRAATRASSRSARSCAETRRTSTTSPPSARPGLQLAGIETGVPVSFGVLTVETVEQAEARDRQGRPRRCARRSRWPTCSPGSGRAPGSSCSSRYNPARDEQDLRNLWEEAGFGTTARTRWWRRSAASTRTCSASACCSRARPRAPTSAPAASRAARCRRPSSRTPEPASTPQPLVGARLRTGLILRRGGRPRQLDASELGRARRSAREARRRDRRRDDARLLRRRRAHAPARASARMFRREGITRRRRARGAPDRAARRGRARAEPRRGRVDRPLAGRATRSSASPGSASPPSRSSSSA